MTVLYRNALAGAADVADWIAEGPAEARDAGGALELRSSGGDEDGDEDGHFTLWCPEELPGRVRIEWDFRPVAEPGLAMLFFGARSTAGGGIFDEGVAARDGAYPQYHSGDLRALHVSYFRRRWPDERAFHTCNLRKAPGFHLVAQGADPLPSAADAAGFHRIAVELDGPQVRFGIDDLPLFEWTDDGSLGPLVEGGRLGFRQMAPLVAHYRDLEVRAL